MARNVVLGMLCAGLGLALPGAAGAATYRCAPQGSDSSDGVRTPWRTLHKAAASLEPGDTVVLADGTYPGGVVIRRSGREGAPITFRAEHPGKAVVRGGHIGILVDNADWVTLDGLTVREAGMRGVRALVAHHLTVTHCILANNPIEGMITGFCNDLDLEDNESYGNGRGYNGPEGEYPGHKGHGIYVSCSGDRPVIRNNRCHDNGGCGIQINGYGDPEISGRLRGINADHVISDAIIQGNVLYRNGKGPDGGGAGMNIMSLRGSLVFDNLLYHNYAGGIAFFSDGGGTGYGCKNNRIVNNTVYFKPNEGRYGLQFLEGSRGNMVRNNIVLAGRGAAIEFDGDSGEPDSDHNVLYSASNSRRVVARNNGGAGYSFTAWQAHGRDRNSRTASADQVFVSPNAATPDFHLASASPAARLGTMVAQTPLAALVGLVRGPGGTVDCGWLPPREPEADGSEQRANDTDDLRPAGAAAIVPDDRRRGH